MTMFCFQCEQAAKGTGCTMGGVCGKQESTARLQDDLVQAVKELAFCNQKLRESGQRDTEADHLTLEFLFATVTNVNFDDNKLADLLRQAKNVIDRFQKCRR